jgi:hypothetical protein
MVRGFITWLRQVFSDETGWGSFSRLALAAHLNVSYVVIGIELASPTDTVPEVVFGFLLTVAIGLIAATGRYEFSSALEGLGKVVAAWRTRKE